MHQRLLNRQLHRNMGADFVPDAQWRPFLEAVSNYYQEVDRERSLLENALALSNEEMTALNAKLRAQSEQEHALLRSFTNSIPDIFFAKNLNGRYLGCNPAFERRVGMREGQIIGKKDSELHFISPEVAASIEALEMEVLRTGNQVTHEESIEHEDGRRTCLEILRSPYFGSDQKPLGLIGIGRDITERRRLEEENWKQANYDMLTGLANRRMLQDRLEHEMRQADRSRCSLALLLIDLDHFKEINDTLGHSIGDELLKEAARRISACTRESDTVGRLGADKNDQPITLDRENVARLGGDEFTVILGGIKDPTHIEKVAQKIISRLAEPFQLGHEMVFQISASVGITVYPEDASEPEELLKNADQAMYVAKRLGRDRFSYFTQGLQTAAQERLRMIGDLRAAISGNQFSLCFQPIMHAQTGCINKAEALLRWNHPTRGEIQPKDFIPLAEETGLIVEIGEFVFREAARWAHRWNAVVRGGFQVSVNASPIQFLRPGDQPLHGTWVDHLKAIGVPGSSIIVEITEGVLLNAEPAVVDTLLGFRNAGIGVAIDDFGTGYSSLAYLIKFDIDFLKIDKQFIHLLSNENSDMAVCKAIIVMAHTLGLQVIAECVETKLQADILTEAGCDFVQGYYFCPPLEPEALDAMLCRSHS